MVSRGTLDQDSRPHCTSDCSIIQELPNDILENIFSRISLVDLITSILVSNDWVVIYASRRFQLVYGKIDRCILINNSNLDIWVFNIVSTRWFELKVPCNWDRWRMKTLGLKATCDGLFLVARFDFTLFVVNPLTAKFKCFPRIHPHTRGCDKFVKCLIVHGIVELQVNRDSGDYRVICLVIGRTYPNPELRLSIQHGIKRDRSNKSPRLSTTQQHHQCY